MDIIQIAQAKTKEFENLEEHNKKCLQVTKTTLKDLSPY